MAGCRAKAGNGQDEPGASVVPERKEMLKTQTDKIKQTPKHTYAQ